MLQGSGAKALPAQQHSAAAPSYAGAPPHSLPASSAALSDKQRSKAEKAARKEEKRRKHAEKAAHKDKHGAKHKKSTLNIERLRQERRDREQAERQRARQAVLGDARARGVIGDGKRYHSAYGNAAIREAAQV